MYHCQLAAVPRLPPLAESVAVAPAHIVLVVVFTEVAAVEFELVLMTMLEQAVVLQDPTAFTK